jgi:hypothetical protein
MICLLLIQHIPELAEGAMQQNANVVYADPPQLGDLLVFKFTAVMRPHLRE